MDNHDNDNRTNSEALEALKADTLKTLNTLPLPSLYRRDTYSNLEAFMEQAHFFGQLLADMANSLHTIGFDPIALAAAMEITGKAATASVLKEKREQQGGKPTVKPFVAYGNSTLN